MGVVSRWPIPEPSRLAWAWGKHRLDSKRVLVGGGRESTLHRKARHKQTQRRGVGQAG